MLFCRKYGFWGLQAEISSANIGVFNLERSWGPTFLGTPHHPILAKIPTPILAFPYIDQARMPPYGQITSWTSESYVVIAV